MSFLHERRPAHSVGLVPFFSQRAVVITSVVDSSKNPSEPPMTRVRHGEWSCGSANAAHPRRAVSIVGPAAKSIVSMERAYVVSTVPTVTVTGVATEHEDRTGWRDDGTI